MDVVSVLVTVFIGFIIFIGALIIIAIFLGIFKRRPNEAQQNYSTVNQEQSSTYSQTKKDVVEDSEGDGLMLFDDPMFPPEFDDEDDDL